MHGLYQDRVAAGQERVDALFELCVLRHEHDGNVDHLAAQPQAELDASDRAERGVGQDQIDPFQRQGGHGFVAVARGDHLQAVGAQCSLQQEPSGLVTFGD